MVAWDIVVDPYLSSPTQRAWIWENATRNPYFGIPFQNFGGWILTTFTICFVYCIIEARIQSRPMGIVTRSIMIMPLAAYVAEIISNIIPLDPPFLLIIGPIMICISIGVASYRLLAPKNTISIQDTQA